MSSLLKLRRGSTLSHETFTGAEGEVTFDTDKNAIVTHGGLDINNNWKTPKSFPWTVFRKSWQKCSLDILSIHAKETKNINLKNKISLAYKKYQNGFYVNSENFVNNFTELCLEIINDTATIESTDNYIQTQNIIKKNREKILVTRHAAFAKVSGRNILTRFCLLPKIRNGHNGQ